MSDHDLPAPDAIWSEPMRLADLSARKPARFALSPDAATRTAIAQWAEIRGVESLHLKGTLSPKGRRDWVLEAEFTARVVQDCVITLEPVVTDLRENVTRRYLADMEMPTAEEVEMPEDDTAEPLPAVVDLGVVALEALELALPLYPRAAGAELGEMRAAEPGVAPLDDEAVKPFANLRAMMEGRPDKGDETDD